MSDDAKGSEAQKSDFRLDLSALNELSLGPNWVSGNVPSSKVPRSRGPERSGTHSSSGGRPPPRRSNERRTRREDGGGGRDRGERGSFDQKGGRGRRFEREEVFEPVLTADFYPEEAPYTALANVIRTSCRTFELFEIAHLILEKPERWVCVAKHPGQKPGEPAIMSASVPDGLPFLSEQEAINHTLTHYLDQFCTIEAVEVDAPAGTFQMIHKCGVTGELLAPPNYHKYTSIIREHHQRCASKMSFEQFQSRLEGVRDEESIAAWLEKMKQRNRYTLKVAEGEEAKVFNDFDDLRVYLMTTAREKLVRPAYSVRVVGKDVHLLPEGDILRKSIETLHAYQLKFPLETANNLRSRLRRTNFHLYKKGSKGISYVCAVKRRFRLKEEVLSESLSDLISFIEAHPNVKASSLPHSYLGIGEKVQEKVASAGHPNKAEIKTADEVADVAVESAEVQSVQPDAEPKAVDTAEAPTEAVKPVIQPIPQEDPQLKLLRRDLHYLVSQGYIVEYSDGRLFALPVREESIEKTAKAKKKSKPAKEEKPKVEGDGEAQAIEPNPDAVPSTDAENVSEVTPASMDEVAKAEPEESLPVLVSEVSEASPVQVDEVAVVEEPIGDEPVAKVVLPKEPVPEEPAVSEDVESAEKEEEATKQVEER